MIEIIAQNSGALGGDLAIIIGGALALLGGAGVMFGQFRRGVVTELRESLGTAQVELGIHKEIVDRLQRTLDLMEERLKALENENKQLHATLEVGTALIPFVRDEFAAFEARVVARHRLLAAAMGGPIGDAMKGTLDTPV